MPDNRYQTNFALLSLKIHFDHSHKAEKQNLEFESKTCNLSIQSNSPGLNDFAIRKVYYALNSIVQFSKLLWSIHSLKINNTIQTRKSPKYASPLTIKIKKESVPHVHTKFKHCFLAPVLDTSVIKSSIYKAHVLGMHIFTTHIKQDKHQLHVQQGMHTAKRSGSVDSYNTSL